MYLLVVFLCHNMSRIIKNLLAKQGDFLSHISSQSHITNLILFHKLLDEAACRCVNGEIGATIKCASANAFYAVGNDDVCETGTFLKRFGANAGDTAGYGNIYEIGAILKCVFFYTRYTAGNDYVCQP